ncbi:hypothetical protein N0V88_005421 [Collariella sp. IMI 366227]|nr:hypothetical protein N0V88_005421 [Collariella sp. IMI 366227]
METHDDDNNKNNPDSTGKAVDVPPETRGTREPPPKTASASAEIHVQDFQDDFKYEETGRPPQQETVGRGSAAVSLAPGWGPGFVDVSGDVGGSGHNETEVDVIAVPCPGADPLLTWTYGHELCGNVSIASEGGSRTSLRRPSPWVTRDLRIASSIARVFLYRHRALEEGMTLDSLSSDLLEQVAQSRRGAKSRPLFFIAHSIGGLVVKSALVRATHLSRFQDIIDSCHGVTFLGTPHRGSSYMTMPNLKHSIQELLRLQAPLPRSLTDQIRINSPELLEMHDKFVDMASELRLWSFYETQESLLSGAAAGFDGEVQFGAPLVSVKSALLDLWQEDVYAMESDHAHIAAFGPSNAGILDSYLMDLALAIEKAARISKNHTHQPLHLRSLVKVEVIGFYDDPDAISASPRHSGSENASIIRLYTTKYSYKDFLRKGPDSCLEERLHKGGKRHDRRLGAGNNNVESAPLPLELVTDSSDLGQSTTTGETSQNTQPEIVVTSPERPPLLRPPALSEPNIRPGTPESTASLSTTVSDTALRHHHEFGHHDGSHTVDLFAKQHAKIIFKEQEYTGTAGFSRPNPSLRKFMWVHMPFNNPVWEIFATISHATDSRPQTLDFSRLFDYDNWVSKQVQNRNSETQPSFLKPTCKYLSSADRIPSPLFFPLITRRRWHGRAKPVPEWVAQQESLELKMTWEYIGYDPPLNCRRTLDQFGHHSLRDTNSRDDDQMLYKLTKKEAPAGWGGK